jgi:hypothetical protein
LTILRKSIVFQETRDFVEYIKKGVPDMANKDAYYFSHDSNALTDPKILSMRCDYGLERIWIILGNIRNAKK